VAEAAENTLYYGDNLDVLRRHVPDESVDLVYLDPPFNSNASYSVLFAEQDGSRSAAQVQAFEDTWRSVRGVPLRWSLRTWPGSPRGCLRDRPRTVSSDRWTRVPPRGAVLRPRSVGSGGWVGGWRGGVLLAVVP